MPDHFNNIVRRVLSVLIMLFVAVIIWREFESHDSTHNLVYLRGYLLGAGLLAAMSLVRIIFPDPGLRRRD